MNLPAYVAGMAIACLVQVAVAMPAPLSISVITEESETPIYTTKAARIANDAIAAILPYRVCQQDKVKYQLGQNKEHELLVHSQERLTGLTILKVPRSILKGDVSPMATTQPLKIGDKVSFQTDDKKLTHGVYVGREHFHSEVSFPLRMLRVQFPQLAKPSLGQPCYDKQMRLIGLIVGISQKGVCHLLPAKAVSFLYTNPKAKRVRLGCLLDINSATPVIEGMINDGPLARIGVLTGDILISINDTPIRNYGDMLDASYYLDGSKEVSVKVIRGTQMLKFDDIAPSLDER
ncbi:MAG: PDZ domain-containing protein [Akkermansia sp.]|nr:PDZ domain-containing protein [Akkermansia sp.]